MILKWKQGDTVLFADEIPIECSCNVRNELNGKRPKPDRNPRDEVVMSIPDGEPVMPRMFPVGEWNVYMPKPKTSPYLAPYFIPTDAVAHLPIWVLDEDGMYEYQSEVTIRDIGYGLHYSTGDTTWGCIKIKYRSALMKLAQDIELALMSGDTVKIGVT